MSAAVPLRADERDPTERLSADDQATQREAEFLQRALLNQQSKAMRLPQGVPGVCSNCVGRCMPTAVYCDEWCRTDHEWRLGLARRTGVRR